MEARIKEHPVVPDKIGALQECKYSFAATTNRGFEDAEYDRVFEIKGTKGSGLVLTSELFGQYVSILLRTNEGEWELLELELEPDAETADDDPLPPL